MSGQKRISPVGFKEIINLTSLGIPSSTIKFKNVTLQSNKFVSVREEGKDSLAVVDTSTKNVLRLPVQVDSAIMNPTAKVVALRAGNNLQIYNLEMRTKMKSTTMENVMFWKWLDTKTIAIVTKDSCYHWSMDGDAAPEKKFDRAPYDGQVQIINYTSSKDEKWLIVGGIAASSSGQGIEGVLQVFSVDANASQPTMNAHAACFSTVTLEGRDSPSNLFCFTQKTDAGASLKIIEVGAPRDQAFRMSSEVNFQGQDFPVAMLPDDKHGCVFIISKAGMLYVYEVQTGKRLFEQQASRVIMFASCVHLESGVVTVDQNGRVAHFHIDEDNVVPFISNTLNDPEWAIQMAQRYDLGGAEGMFQQQFNRLMQSQQYQKAMELAVTSPKGILRTIDTINQLKSLPAGAVGGSSSPLLQYFSLLLKRGKLNAVESLELARPVLARGQPQGLKHIEEWLKQDKLECSEDLGDLLKQADLNLALSVFVRAKVPEKVIGCFLALGAREVDSDTALQHFKKIFQYASHANFQPDYPLLVQQLLRVNADRAKDFALLLVRGESGPTVDVETLVRTFMQANDVKNTTNILLEYLKNRGDLEEDAELQTKLLEINLFHMPQVADAIMESEDYNFTHYDRQRIAQLCERAQLYQRALEHYTELDDIKRVLSNTSALNPEFLLEFFGRMTPENCLDCLHDLLKFNLNQNIRLVVEVAKKWSDYLKPEKLIELFEAFKSWNGLYHYLGSFVNYTEDSQVVFKFIEAAVRLTPPQLREVERVCRDNDHYDPKQVKQFLLDANLKDPRPLIHVCDRYDFVDELTQYLYSHQMFPFIEAYVQRMNPRATPKVLGALLDMNANEDEMSNLIQSIRPPVDDPDFVQQLVSEVEKRNRLKMLQKWLEARQSEGSEDVAVHNGLAKIYVDTNNRPEQFLTSNRFYDSAEVGKYCESRDPHLAFVAYKRAWGACDEQLVEVTNKNGFFKDQAKYLVERQDLELWATVLEEKNEHRRQLIDQVVATALPESKVAEEVSTTVKAFMAANLPNELIELLERIILRGSADGPFHRNKNLQNLLILTAIKADKKRVADYINRLDNYDGPDIAEIACNQYELYDEAFFIYKKFKKGPEAIRVLLDHMHSIERATEFAEYWDDAPVWSLLAKAQLDNGMAREAIASYLKADDPKQYDEVIRSAKEQEIFAELIDYLLMARKTLREATVDNELIYAYARTERLTDLEEFISGPHQAKIEVVGDQCYNEGQYQAARLLFSHINNNAKLALALVKLEKYSEAVDAARKANAIPTWEAVCFACVDAEKFRLAQMCGLSIIVYNDHLQGLIRYYENRCFFNEVIQVLEQGINLDRAHQGIYTQLGILYAKYKEDKLMEHVKLFWSRLNIPTLIQACKDNLHWPEAVFLFSHYDQYDNAVDVLIQHSADCWKHDLFKETLSHVSNTEIYYRAIDFYLAEHPMELNDLLLDLAANLDHSRVVSIVRQANHLPLVKKYLLHVQRENVAAVNEALNELFLLEEDYKALRESIDVYDQFDQIALAQRVEGHELLQFRRIAAYLYKLNKRWEKSIELSKQDELWADAMETASESQNQELAEELLRFFVERGFKEGFAAMLFTSYELIRPDVVLELAWRQNLMDFAMPFMIQCFRDYDDKINDVTRRLDEAQKAKSEDESKSADGASQDASLPSGYLAPLPLMGPGMGGGMGGPYQQSGFQQQQHQQYFPQ